MNAGETGLFPWRAPLAADWQQQWTALDNRVRAIHASTSPAECEAISNAARRLAGQDLASIENIRLEKLAQRMLPHAARFPRLRHVRIGVIGNRTLSYLTAQLPAAGLARGMLVEAIEIPYDAAAAAALGGAVALQQSKLEAVVIVLDADSLIKMDMFLEEKAEMRALVEAQTFLLRLTGAMSRMMGSTAVVATVPPDRVDISSSELALPGSTSRFSMRLNELIVDGARRRDWVMWDLAALAVRVGAENWFDAVRFHEAKTPFHVGLAPLVADHLCRTLAALVGKSCRALVLDLDNTLWGGDIGDDGMAGIRLGENSAEGEAYLSFQRFILNLRRRGVALAVCSKNTDSIAREPFRTHPDMLLREEHIAIFQANWEDKASNLQAIADALGLDPESVAFADDNAAERQRVRQELPLVSVPEIGADPANYAARVADSGVFDHLLLTIDDQMRAGSYQSRAAGAELKSKIGNYDEYLRSLKMSASASRFDPVSRARIAQLINKSNQFNLTTRRYSESDVQQFELSHDGILCWQVRLEDVFGPHGIIAIIIVRKEAMTWTIDTWLMSCRALTRGIEEALMNLLMAEARQAGAETLIGEYIATPRNALVADFYPRLGFTKLDNQLESATRYRAQPASFKPLKHFIDAKLC
jgi:FkbH-like protein